MSSSLPTILRAFNKEPLSLSMLELRRVVLKSVGLEGEEDEVRESSMKMGPYIRPRQGSRGPMDESRSNLLNQGRASEKGYTLSPGMGVSE